MFVLRYFHRWGVDLTSDVLYLTRSKNPLWYIVVYPLGFTFAIYWIVKTFLELGYKDSIEMIKFEERNGTK